MIIAKVTSKGQVTIPLAIREKLGLTPHTEVEFQLSGDAVKVKKAKTQTRGRSLVEHMKGRGSGRLSTDQIMALTRGE